jgi:ATP-dependent Clp protease adapter protein ClpS
MNSEVTDLSKNRFVVSIYELRERLVFADEFSGQYTKSVRLSDGTTRTIELTPMVRDGESVIEFKDTGHRSYMGMIRVRTGGHTNEDSNQTMLAIHKKGGALIPTLSLTEAERIAAQITAEAAKQGYPLKCRPVTVDP